MQRDKFKCVDCGNDKNTLHVHHSFYCGEPWEDKFLLTLCEDCHQERQGMESDAKRALSIICARTIPHQLHALTTALVGCAQNEALEIRVGLKL